VSQSFQNCLAARGARPQGDCGYQLGQALVLAVWGMAAAPTIAFLLELGEANVAIVGAGLTVFAMFSAYAVRIFGAARALR
ncbi:MAG: hypothetical protein KDA41_12195, partial [Planctomycetales bacterium]|nr:hypothetical protein [Planctomycetales bacterium]